MIQYWLGRREISDVIYPSCKIGATRQRTSVLPQTASEESQQSPQFNLFQHGPSTPAIQAKGLLLGQSPKTSVKNALHDTGPTPSVTRDHTLTQGEKHIHTLDLIQTELE